ncbi:MAG: dephospho-CoA kinase [Pseudomonadota bacterium]|nr:dephospho-CoA kinase [Pseudomonadota bacterium]
MPFVVGVTGGIAAGKSTATDFFAARGVPVLDADIAAREVVAPGSPGLAAVRSAFGDAVIAADGSLDRRKLRALIFADDSRRRTLEHILHPRIHARIRQQLAKLDAPWVILSVPLLVNSELRELIHRTLVIDAEPEVQIKRVMARDDIDADQAGKILAAQSTREERLAIADDVVDNSGDPQALTAQLERLANLYDRLAATHPRSGESRY